MWPLKSKKADPAPSRIAYRLNRIWLRPFYKKLIGFGAPFCFVVGIALTMVTDPVFQFKVSRSVEKVRAQIEERPEFMVQLLYLKGVSTELAGEIRSFGTLKLPVSSFRIDLEQIKKDVEALDAVKKATLVLRSGGILEMQIAPRLPAVLWRTAEGLEVLDVHGKRAAMAENRMDFKDLPLIAGTGANENVSQALRVLSAAKTLNARIRGLVRIGERRWDLVLDRSQIIMLPSDNPAAALVRVIALDRASDLLARDVVVIDMRNGKRPLARLSIPTMEQLHILRTAANGEEV